jgi:NhaP-type Na+/H+ or K+/H+ antiporter
MQSVKDIVPIAGLLGIMSIGYIILEKYNKLAIRLSAKFSKVWVIAEILLFVYIGSELKMSELNWSVLGTGIVIVVGGLLFRSIGVLLSLYKSKLNVKEKLFCVFAYFPKATVQAAIGAIPLTMYYEGKMDVITLENAKTILAFAVLSIIVTAPLGSILIRVTGHNFLEAKCTGQ